MPRFIDPSGHENYGIGLCDRCHFKFPLDELFQDPNYPGLRVCEKDRDQYDPWRLPARQTERINLPFNRPDVSVANPLGDYTVDANGDLHPNTGFKLPQYLTTLQGNELITTEDGQSIQVQL